MCIKKTLFFHFVPAADFSQADKQCCCWCCCCCCGNTTGSDLGYAARRQSVMILFDKESIRNSVSLRSLLLSFFLRSATKLVPSVMSRVSDCTPSPHSAARYWLRALFLCPLQTRRKGFTQLNPSWVQQEALKHRANMYLVWVDLWLFGESCIQEEAEEHLHKHFIITTT